MDFWEVIKVVVRRWVVTVPLLVLTAAVAVLLPPTIDPNYAASTSTAVISPEENDSPLNPFLAIGPVAMAQGLASTADSPSAMEQIRAAGGSTNYGVQVNNSRSPILNIQIEADTPEQAAQTGVLVLELIRTQLADRQAAAGAPPETQYYTQDLTGVPVAVPVYDGQQRVLFLSIGLGIGLTIAVALAMEGVSLVRRRRRDGETEEPRPSTIEQRLALLDEREQLLLERERLLLQRDGDVVAYGRRARSADTSSSAGASPERAVSVDGRPRSAVRVPRGPHDDAVSTGEIDPFERVPAGEGYDRRQRSGPRS